MKNKATNLNQTVNQVILLETEEPYSFNNFNHSSQFLNYYQFTSSTTSHGFQHYQNGAQHNHSSIGTYCELPGFQSKPSGTMLSLLEKLSDQAIEIRNLKAKLSHQSNASKNIHSVDNDTNKPESQKISDSVGKGQYISTEYDDIRIIVFGITKLSRDEIIESVVNKFKVSYNKNINPKKIKIITSGIMNELKKKNILNSLKFGKYDYMIVGPHPHSISGKNAKITWCKFLQKKFIDTLPYEDYRNPISKSTICKAVDEFGDDLFMKELSHRA